MNWTVVMLVLSLGVAMMLCAWGVRALVNFLDDRFGLEAAIVGMFGALLVGVALALGAVFA